MRRFATPLLLTVLSLLVAPIVQAADAEVRMHQGRPVVFIDGKPNPMVGYCPIGWSKTHFEQGVDHFFHQKMNYYQIMLPSTHSELGQTPYWFGDDISDQPLISEPTTKMQGFADLRESGETIVKGDPDAWIMVRFGIDPPSSWTKLHPEHMWIDEEGKPAQGPSLGSDLYWSKAAQFCTTIVKLAESQPWANRVIGYVNLYQTEGTPVPAIEGNLYDYNPLMVAKWREFLRQKYGTSEKLREAWHDEDLRLETVEVPKDKLRGPTPVVSNWLYWQAPETNQPLRDWLDLLRDLYHARARQIYAAMRAGTDQQRIFVYDMYKQQMMGWNCGDFFYNQQSRRLGDLNLVTMSGSRGVTGLWDTPGFDGILTPHDYQARGPGGIFQPEGIADSAVLRGKLFICEMDQRTYVDENLAYGLARNFQEWEAISWRNLATALSRGFLYYYMDLYSDWYKPEEIQKSIGRQVEVLKQAVNWPHQTVPGIAMIIDDNAIMETNGAGNFENEAIMWEQKMGLARCGVPYRIYLLDDLALPNFPQHRVFYFPNLYKVDDERLALLKEKILRDGNVVIWGPGSGISDGQQISAESAAALTGFSFKFWPVNFTRKTLLSNFDHPLTQGLPADTVISGVPSYGPLLFPTDGTELGLAWTKNGDTIAGLAAKEVGEGAARYFSVFTSAVPLPAGLWRNAARWAGAHVYSEGGDVLMADSTIVALHSLQSGEKRIVLPGTYTVWDVVSGGLVGRELKEIHFRLEAPQTRVFRLETIPGA